MERISAVPGPALATLTKERFSRDGWIFERKLDGMRVLASSVGDTVRLRSRNDLDAAGSFPEVVEAFESLDLPDFVVDGEVVAFDGAQTSFALLQRRMHVSDPAKARRSGVTVFYYVFDLLHLDGHSTRGLPLRERKALLRDLLDWQDPLRFTRHRNADGESYFEEACGKGWEGLIAKRADSIYRTGRTPDWLKFKCEQSQEFVIGGWTEPQGARSGFGALLLGYYDEAGALRYAGKVGTGFDATRLATVMKQLRAVDTADAVRRKHSSEGSGVASKHPLGGAGSRRPDRVQRVDPGRAAAAPPLPGAAHGQESSPGGPRGARRLTFLRPCLTVATRITGHYAGVWVSSSGRCQPPRGQNSSGDGDDVSSPGGGLGPEMPRIRRWRSLRCLRLRRSASSSYGAVSETER